MKIKQFTIWCMVLTLAASTGCANKGDTRKAEEPKAQGLQSLSAVAAENDMQVQVNPDSSCQLGHTDPLFTLRPDQVQVQSGDETIVLPDPPKLQNGELFLTPQSVQKLFSDPSVLGGSAQQQQQGVQSFAKANVNASSLISFGRQYMGTPYHFASGPYTSTHTFDCSSFVQYVYGHFGIRLPRASKDQAKVGQLVARQNLRPGDIIFFYTPGRYASNRIVGHVGIYIGNNQILQTYGKPGVTISNLNSPNWSRRFLHARRVF